MLGDIPQDEHRKIDSINGWIELGNFDEAAKELSDLHPKLKATIEFVKAWVLVYEGKKRWAEAELLCETLVKQRPRDPFGILHMAEALHQQGKDIGAIEVLGAQLEDEDWRGSPVVLYALARYFCAAGQLKEARECLRKGIDADKGLRMKALNDPDLKALWTEDQDGRK